MPSDSEKGFLCVKFLDRKFQTTELLFPKIAVLKICLAKLCNSLCFCFKHSSTEIVTIILRGLFYPACLARIVSWFALFVWFLKISISGIFQKFL